MKVETIVFEEYNSLCASQIDIISERHQDDIYTRSYLNSNPVLLGQPENVFTSILPPIPDQAVVAINAPVENIDLSLLDLQSIPCPPVSLPKSKVITAKKSAKDSFFANICSNQYLSRSKANDDMNFQLSMPRQVFTEGADGVTLGSSTTVIASKRKKSTISLTNIDPAIMRLAKKQAEAAINQNKVFAVLGPYRHIREGLRRRGWVEKFYRAAINVNGDKMAKINLHFIDDRDVDEEGVNEYRSEDDQDEIIGDIGGLRKLPWEEDGGYFGLIARSLRPVCPNFIWSLRKAQIDFKCLQRDQIVNHHSKAPFTTKIGLCRHLKNARWYDDQGSDYFFPRCYVLSAEDDLRQFMDDYRLTACASILKWVCNYCGHSISLVPVTVKGIDLTTDDMTYEKSIYALTDAANQQGCPPNQRLGTEYMAMSRAIAMSIVYCEAYLKVKRHEDLDENTSVSFTVNQWDQLFQCFFITFKEPTPYTNEDVCYRKCQNVCKKLGDANPQIEIDGKRNIWIVKPGAKSRGRGIMCHNRLTNILAPVTGALKGIDPKYVVQKYIENPLLIFNTKFDIRQWFLVTEWSPLTVWWYKDCYFRFCSREFTMDNFCESAHLSNNSVSHKYKNGPRSQKLPRENMWYLHEFRKYLQDIGHGATWEERILPGMRKSIINSLLCSQESIDVRKHCFELYGADFMITENDLQPWLLEINASPCMAPSTAVTMDLAAKVLEDTLKVIIDRKENRDCETGGFELIYQQSKQAQPAYSGIDLRISGRRIFETTHVPETVHGSTTLSTKLRTGSVPAVLSPEPNLRIRGDSCSLSRQSQGKTPINKDIKHVDIASKSPVPIYLPKPLEPLTACTSKMQSNVRNYSAQPFQMTEYRQSVRPALPTTPVNAECKKDIINSVTKPLQKRSKTVNSSSLLPGFDMETTSRLLRKRKSASLASFENESKLPPYSATKGNDQARVLTVRALKSRALISASSNPDAILRTSNSCRKNNLMQTFIDFHKSSVHMPIHPIIASGSSRSSRRH